MWMRRAPKEPEQPGGVGDECEAWLAGEWAEYRTARGQGVPSWAWLNRVAHCPEQALRLMTRMPAWTYRNDEWFRLRGCVAESLLKQAAEKRVSVDELQRSVLVPIECEMFGHDNPGRPANAQLMLRVLAALHHPSAQPGS